MTVAGNSITASPRGKEVSPSPADDRAVLVVGIGLHSAFGNLEQTWQELQQGHTAVTRVRLPGASGFPEVPCASAGPFNLSEFLADRKLQKYMNPAAELAVLAAGRALADADLLKDDARRAELALFTSTGLIAFDIAEVAHLINRGKTADDRVDLPYMGQNLRLCHPLLPFKMLLNMPLGLVSIVFGIRGQNFILYPGADQGGACLEAAVRGIRTGRFSRALVGGSAQNVSLMPLSTLMRLGHLAAAPELARPQMAEHAGYAAGDLGAFLVIESAASAAERGGRAYAAISEVAEARAPKSAPSSRSELRSALWRKACGGLVPDNLISTGAVNAADDRSEKGAADSLWANSPALFNFDGLLGHGGTAAFSGAAALSCLMLERGFHADRPPPAAVLVSSSDPEGGLAAVLLTQPSTNQASVESGVPEQTTSKLRPQVGTESLNAEAAPDSKKALCGARSSSPRRRVVVTGMGVVSPIGTGLPSFIEGLRQARPGIDVIRSFDAGTFPSRIAGEVKDLRVGALALPPSERAALLRDPKSIFGLVAAREALENAFGSAAPTRYYPPARLSTFIAAGLEIFNLEDLVSHVTANTFDAGGLLEKVRAAPPLSHLQIPAHLGAACAAREAGAEGLFAVNVSACAAGTQALGEAFLAIRDGVTDAVIAGGYDSMVNPLGVGGFCMLQALSLSNHLRSAASRPFDARRDGFVLGEGSGMCVLEEYEAAKRRGARIYGEILGYSSTLDAYRVSDPPPDQAGAIAAMRAALEDARLGPEQIDYINAHGTGTRKNDPAETKAIRQVFGEMASRIPVSSTKSQIGHLIGAAGAVEFIAGLFALNEGILPATINLTEPDPECDLDYVPLVPRPARIHTFLSNSFGFGGQNATIIAGRVRE